MNSNSLLYAVIALTGLTFHSAAGDPYREMFAIRSSIRAAIGEKEWMISYMVEGDSIKASGMSRDGRVFKASGRIDAAIEKPDPLMPGTYRKLKVSFSDERGDLYEVDLFGGQAAAVHWTYDSYRHFLEEQFRFHGFERFLKNSPRKYIFSEDDPEIVMAAMKLKPERSRISKLLDGSVGTLGFFSQQSPDGTRKVGKVLPGSVAEHSGMLQGDVIVGTRVDFEAKDFEALSNSLKENVGGRFDFIVRRGDQDRLIVMFRPSPLEYRLAAMPALDDR